MGPLFCLTTHLKLCAARRQFPSRNPLAGTVPVKGAVHARALSNDVLSNATGWRCTEAEVANGKGRNVSAASQSRCSGRGAGRQDLARRRQQRGMGPRCRRVDRQLDASDPQDSLYQRYALAISAL